MAIQVLFHLEFQDEDPEEVFERLCENFDFGRSLRSFCRQLVVGVSGKRRELDNLIGAASKNWRIERMSRLDRCILRLAVYELMYMEDIPPKVSIDEAVELGKKFGTEESGSFVNGVLDNVYNRLQREKNEGRPENTVESLESSALKPKDDPGGMK